MHNNGEDVSALRRISKYPLCAVGVHTPPPARYPHGPVVADCACCGKTCYFYGLSAYGLGGPPILMPITIRQAASAPR